MQQFEKYLNAHAILSDGWKDIENPGFEGKAVETTGQAQLGEGRLLTFKASLHSALVGQATQSYRSTVWAGVTMIGDPATYQEEDNQVVALVNHCPGRQWWLSINPDSGQS